MIHAAQRAACSMQRAACNVGLKPTLIGIVPYAGLSFAAFETSKAYIKRKLALRYDEVRTVAVRYCALKLGQRGKGVHPALAPLRTRMTVLP